MIRPYLNIIPGMAAALILMATTPAWAFSRVPDLPLAARMVLVKAYPLLEQKAYERAAAVLTKFQSRGPAGSQPGDPDPHGYHHPEVYYALGNCHLLQEQYPAAAKAYRQATARNAGHTFAWLNQAKAHYEMAQYSAAARCFIQGYETESGKDPQHLYYAAAARLMADEPQGAIEIFQRLCRSHPAAIKPEWKEHYIHAFLAANQNRRALPLIRELVALYSGEKKIRWQEILLHQYLYLQMPGEALDMALSLARQAPTEPRWWKALVHINLNAGRLEEACATLTIYAFLEPLTPEENRLLADLNLQLGIPAKAAPLYEMCLQAKPDSKLVQRLVQAYRQLGRPEKALEILDDFKPRQDIPELAMLRGDLLYALRRYDEAARVFRHAAHIKGRHRGRAWLMAGYSAWQINDIAGGKAAFARAAEYQSQIKAATSALDQLTQQAL